MLRSAALAGALLCWSVSAHALTPVAQDRHVFGQREDGFGNVQVVLGYVATETRSAPDYAPFSASTDGYSFPIEGGTPVAVQSSTLGMDQLDASGSADSHPTSNPTDGERILGESLYSVTFEVESPRSYTLSGQIDLETSLCAGTTEARIRLTGASGVLAQVSQEMDGHISFSDQISAPLSTTLFLPVGTYTLEARSRTDGLGGQGTHTGDLCDGGQTSSYEVHLAPVPPEVPALPTPWLAALAAALALAARRLAARPQAGFAPSASIARHTSSSTRKADAATGQPA